MKIAVTGHRGYIGGELIKAGLIPLDCNVLNQAEIQSELLKVKPDVVIHCAAKTDVDWCENNTGAAFDVNARGTNNLVNCLERGQLLVYLSTYHVFNGKRLGMLGGYTEKHDPSPVNIYGITKFGGETLARMGVCDSLVVRIGKLFDKKRVEAKLKYIMSTESQLIEPMNDVYIRSYMYLGHFILTLMMLVENHDQVENGIIHVAGVDSTLTEYRFWKFLLRYLGVGKDISNRTQLYEELGDKITHAPRPVKCGLDVSKLKKLAICEMSSLEDGFISLAEEMEWNTYEIGLQ